MEKEFRYVLMTSLPLKSNGVFDCEGFNGTYHYKYTAEPQILDLMLGYKVSKIIAIGTNESIRALTDKSNEPATEVLAADIDDIFSIKDEKCKAVYYDMFRRISSDDRITEKYNGTVIPVKLVISEEADVNNYWADLYRAINDGAENKEIRILIDSQGGGRTERFVQNSLMSVISTDGRISIEKVISSYPIDKNNKNFRIRDDTEQYKNVWSLVSAVDVFERYGRTDLLYDYFADKVNADEKRLLDNMVEFDRAIALSDSDKVMAAADELARCFSVCKKQVTESSPLFSTMLTCMEDNYGDVLSAPDNRRILYVILWCVKKDFIQQALTLYESHTTKLHAELFGETYTDTDAKNRKDWTQYIPNRYTSKENAIRNAIDYLINHKEIKFPNNANLGIMINNAVIDPGEKVFLTNVAFKNIYVTKPQGCCWQLDLKKAGLEWNGLSCCTVDDALDSLKNTYAKKLAVRDQNDDYARLITGKSVKCGPAPNDFFVKKSKTVTDKLQKAIDLLVVSSPDKRQSMLNYLIIKIIRNTANHGSNVDSLSDDTAAAAKYIKYKMNVSVPSGYSEIKQFIEKSVTFLIDIADKKTKNRYR